MDEPEVIELLRLMAAIAVEPGNLHAKRRKLVEGLAMVIHADAWAWIVSRASDHHGAPAIAHYLHGGMTEEQYAYCLRISQDRANMPVEFAELNRLRQSTRCFTRTWDQLVDPIIWYGEQNQKRIAESGFEHLMYCVHVLDGDGYFSGICFKRKIGSHNFTARESRIVEMVTSQVAWLHGDPNLSQITHKVRQLPPRLHPVLAMLNDGKTIKETAVKLHLKQNTIKSYTKDIYKYFKVTSRAQLHYLFISGGGGG